MSNHFDQLIRYKALAFKFSGAGFSLVDAVLEQNGPEALKMKQVCAPLSVQLVERMENVLGLLNMSKREFIEIAVIEALDKAEAIIDEENVFEYHEAMDAAEKGEAA